jgi:hypothetical protein
VVDVSWQGDEPTLMGLDFFGRSVELVDRYLQPGQAAAYTIQTNGTRAASASPVALARRSMRANDASEVSRGGGLASPGSRGANRPNRRLTLRDRGAACVRDTTRVGQ